MILCYSLDILMIINIIVCMGASRMEAVDTVEFAKALADETRQKIMVLCCCKQLSVNDIVDALDVTQPTVSHHLKILKTA